MKELRLFPVMLLLACAGLFAQNVSLEEAIQTSAQAIDSRLPQGSKVAVLSFTAANQGLSSYVIDEIAVAISASNKIKVIERQYLDAIRKELNIQMSGDVSDDEVRRVGHQLGAQYVITGALVDIGNAYRFRVAAINVESAVREASPVSNININDTQIVFLLTGQRAAQTDTTPGNSGTYKIGDTGPGGGIIFMAEGNSYMEVSRILGGYKWARAVKVAKDFRGGGYRDWHLPSKEELNMVYQNLQKSGVANLGTGTYWSSSLNSYRSVWVQDFSNGSQPYYHNNNKNFTFSVRAVRAF